MVSSGFVGPFGEVFRDLQDLLEDTEHGAKILGLHQDLQAQGA